MVAFLLPDFTVSSYSEVKSILLISRFPIENLSGKKVALTSTSATSQVLLKLILSRGYEVQPEYTVCPPDLDRMLADADAALLIGDIALKYYVARRELFLHDLGPSGRKADRPKNGIRRLGRQPELCRDKKRVV